MAVNGHKRTMQAQNQGFLVLSALTWCLLVRLRGWQREEWGGPLHNFRLKRITVLLNLLSPPKFKSTFSNSVVLLKFSSVFSPGDLFSSNTFERGAEWRRRGHLRGGGGLFNLAKVVVSVFDKELESKENKLKQEKLEAIQPRIKKDSQQVKKPSPISPR